MNLSSAFQDKNPTQLANGKKWWKKYEMVCLQKLLDSPERKKNGIFFGSPLRNSAFAHSWENAKGFATECEVSQWMQTFCERTFKFVEQMQMFWERK